MPPTPPAHAVQWRPMSLHDLPAVHAVAHAVHPSYFEGLEVFAERLLLHPAGCQVLVQTGPQNVSEVIGYVLSHPWRYGEPPALNSLVDALPEFPDTFYVHDLALLPTARGTGAAAIVVSHLREHAKSCGWSRMSLVAVNESVSFWRRQGFEVVRVPGLDTRLASYDPTACFMAAYSALAPVDVTGLTAAPRA
ncbi:GNAT family N-acetyltransferase [Pigmentiphaga aceris]|uniref:GNAT family N-acetyltransferase n=1 Tax=Pigmentiphaga aceris TaxID=1940612 RepID=A0A5C0AQZ7_9BURK|nr:GNAT family N-acetyltransferase [Pigmentiphaga aceris]QEI04468.1 GNAT family N-acetyltransferase [Pigmentiphaga aceris]